MIKVLITILLSMCLISQGYCVTQWDKSIPSSGANLTAWPAAVTSQWSILDTLVSNYQRGETVIYKNSTTLTVTLGEITVSNSGNTLRLFLQDTGNTDITTANLDSGGSFSNSTTYYVYAAASSATAASSTYYISLSSSSPTGPTYYAKIGSFTTDGSGNVVPYQVYKSNYGTSTTDSSGNSLVPLSIWDYSTSTSSYTAQYGNKIRIAYGGAISIGSGSSQSITNLPFNSSSTYQVVCSMGSVPSPTSDESAGIIACVPTSGSSFTIYNTDNITKSVRWYAVGY